MPKSKHRKKGREKISMERQIMTAHKAEQKTARKKLLSSFKTVSMAEQLAKLSAEYPPSEEAIQELNQELITSTEQS